MKKQLEFISTGAKTVLQPQHSCIIYCKKIKEKKS
ncbi:hypothetical protein D8886_02155 [Streptococcus sanguinis]|nr:hypothetical protein D8886_02155 [Streptococcus sanguinis]